MRATRTRRVHLPDWVVPNEVAHTLADEYALRWNVYEKRRSRLTLEESPVQWEVTETGTKVVRRHSLTAIQTREDDECTWCWRHLRRCWKGDLSWTVSNDEPGT